MPKETWWNLPEEKRARVLDAAMAEFGRRGFSAGSLNVVARQARIAKGSLFQYFDDKLDLFAVTCLAAADRIRDTVLDGLDTTASAGFFALLRQITDRWVDYFATHPLEQSVAVAAAHEIDPDARAAIRSVVNARFVDTIRPLVQHAVDRDEFGPEVDPGDVVAMVVLVLRHLDSAPFIPHVDPVLGLYGQPAPQVKIVAQRLVAALERAYASPAAARTSARSGRLDYSQEAVS